MSSISTSNNTIEAPPVPGMPPVHPGAVLEEILIDHGLGVDEAAARLGVARQTLQGLLAGRQRVSAAMALRLGRLCRNGPEIWLNLQSQYDLARARAQAGAALEAVKPLPADH
jgi:addiction module HigA family antidote